MSYSLEVMGKYVIKPRILLRCVALGILHQIAGMISHSYILRTVGIMIPFISIMWIYAVLSVTQFDMCQT